MAATTLHRGRLWILALCILAGFAAVGVRLGYVQLVEGDVWAERVHKGQKLKVRIPAVRGFLRDRHGVILADNRPSYDVDLYLPDVVQAYKEEAVRQNKKMPTIQQPEVVGGERVMRDLPDIALIVEESILPRLRELGEEINLDPEALRSHYRKQQLVPYNLLSDLSFEQVARFQEKAVNVPGIFVNTRPVRRYLYGAMLAHVIGYVGKPVDIYLEKDAKEYRYYQPDEIGKAGIEKFRDEEIRGLPGLSERRRDRKSGTDEEIRRIEPTQGADIWLTVDSRIQTIMEDSMRSVGRGAAVMMDPRNGDVLGMVSVPSFDPNHFIPSIQPAEWEALQADKTNPLLNRAVSASSPGSTFKVFVGLAGLHAGVGNRSFNCSGRFFVGGRAKPWMCHKASGHGSLDMPGALKVSCNCYFYQFAIAAGIDDILEVGHMLGFGELSGIDVQGESPGILPGPDFLKRMNPKERWSNGHTANVAIGQGAVNVSPLQMAVLASTVGNMGKVYYPNMVHKIVDQDGNIQKRGLPRIRTDLMKEGFTTAQLDIVRKGMWEVVNEDGGTGKRARQEEVEVGGKTGTAQVYYKQGKNDAWFIAFVPFENPTMALAIWVEGAKAGGLVGAPIAGKVFRETLALEKEPFFDLHPLTPAKGSFDFVNEVNFDLEVPASKSAPREDPSSEERPTRTASNDSAPAIRDRRAADEPAPAAAAAAPRRRFLFLNLPSGNRDSDKSSEKRKPGRPPGPR